MYLNLLTLSFAILMSRCYSVACLSVISVIPLPLVYCFLISERDYMYEVVQLNKKESEKCVVFAKSGLTQKNA